MTPEEISALASAAGVAIAIAFGLAGLAVGTVGLVQARRARYLAADANRLAVEANGMSREANELAQEANELAHGNAAQANEQHDVEWEWEWDRAHNDMVTVKNVGQATALGAVVQFFYQDKTESADPLDIEGGGMISLQVPGLREDISAERTRLSDFIEKTSDPNFIGTVPWIPREVRTRLRVAWRSELGTPKKFESNWETYRGLPL